MPEFTVLAVATASQSITVNAKTVEDALDAAVRQADFRLCHQCSSRMDVGDPDVDSVVDESGNQIWSNRSEE